MRGVVSRFWRELAPELCEDEAGGESFTGSELLRDFASGEGLEAGDACGWYVCVCEQSMEGEEYEILSARVISDVPHWGVHFSPDGSTARLSCGQLMRGEATLERERPCDTDDCARRTHSFLHFWKGSVLRGDVVDEDTVRDMAHMIEVERVTTALPRAGIDAGDLLLRIADAVIVGGERMRAPVRSAGRVDPPPRGLGHRYTGLCTNVFLKRCEGDPGTSAQRCASVRLPAFRRRAKRV